MYRIEQTKLVNASDAIRRFETHYDNIVNDCELLSQIFISNFGYDYFIKKLISEKFQKPNDTFEFLDLDYLCAKFFLRTINEISLV